MGDLIIESRQGTPEINFSSATGVLKIKGRANANDITLFYKQIDIWLDEYLLNPKPLTTVELQLEYINSVFSKLLFTFFEKCKSVIQKDKKLVIKWYHQKDDEDSMDDATKYSKIINLPIEQVELD